MQKPRGFVSISFLLLVGFVVFSGYLAFIIAPPYYENKQIEDSLKLMARDSEVVYMSKAKLTDALSRHLEVNNIRHFKSDQLTLEESDKKSYLVLNYEVRSHVISNIDIVQTFKNRVLVE